MTEKPKAPYEVFAEAALIHLASAASKSYREIAREISLASHINAVARLIQIAESAKPARQGSNLCGEVVLPANGGWTVSFHYGADSRLRYINYFVSPSGQMIDFWEWAEEVPGRDVLMAWCGPEQPGASAAQPAHRP